MSYAMGGAQRHDPSAIGHEMYKRLRIAFVVGLTVLLCDAVVPFVLAKRVAQQREIVSDIESNTRHFNRLLSAYKDAETGERGFLLSGRPEFLSPYTSGRQIIDTLLPQLSGLTAMLQPAEYADLLELDRQEAKYQRDQIDARRAGRAPGLEDIARGKNLMDAIRIRIGAIVERANARVAVASARARQLEAWSRWLIVIVTAVDVLLFSATFWFAMRLLRSEQYAGRVAEVANEYLLAEGSLRYEAMRKLEVHADKLNQIIEMQTALTQTTSCLEDFLALVVDRMLSLSSADGAVIEMVEGDELVYLAGSGSAADFVGLRLARGTSLSGLCIAEKKEMIASDVANDPRVNREAAAKIGAAAVMVAPLFRTGEAVGVLKILSSVVNGFDESDIQTLRLVAGLLGAALADRLAIETNVALLEERSRALVALGQQQQLLHSITDGIPALVAFIDAEECHQYTNRQYSEILGKDPVGKTIRQSVGEEKYLVLKPHIEKVLSGSAVDFENRLETLNGSRYTHGHFIPQFDEAGRTIGFCSIAWDIHARKEQEMKWQSRALVDQLTGALNRFSLIDAVEQALARQRQLNDGGKLAVFYLDVDHFKCINDTHGHAAGDTVLREFASALKSAIRASDILGRIGGDEFCILADNVGSIENARRIADKVLDQVRAIGVDKTGLPPITTSLGIAFIGGGTLSAKEAIELADTALYEAKQAGRNRHAERSVSLV
ncbi:MAG: hypothetical protein JWL63_3559 [Rhodocyclales bacterium]|nr:hypothetical protein [Rhodocyclales bacterium]